MRLKARLISGVKVPVLANTAGPVIESNCARAITLGGEQLEMNNQSVTRVPNEGTKVNSIRSADLASLRNSGEAQNKIALPAQREWIAAGGDPQMIGDGMNGRSSDVNQGTTAGGKRASRGQSPRKSWEAGNDRGAKGGRDVVWTTLEPKSHKGLGSAARLFAQMHRNTGLKGSGLDHSGPPAQQVSGAKACAAGNDFSKPGVECLSQSISDHELESRMRENRPSGLGGGRRRNPFSIHIMMKDWNAGFSLP